MSENPLRANIERYKDKYGAVYQIEKVGDDFVLSLVSFKKELQGRGHKRKEVVVPTLNTYLRASNRDALWLYLIEVTTAVKRMKG